MMEKLIYRPSGRAREYSPYTLNIYNGCEHQCKYCYVPKFRGGRTDIQRRKDLIKNLEMDIIRNGIPHEQILISFFCDPYTPMEMKVQDTRSALELLYKHEAMVSILTKAGMSCLKDIDLFLKFGKNISVATTLTLDNAMDSKYIEPYAARPEERIYMLQTLKQHGIKTWVSIEPVIDPEQTYRIIEKSIPYTDYYKIGKINHVEMLESGQIDWAAFLYSVVAIMRHHNKPFYIKEDLRKLNRGTQLKPEETEMDHLILKKQLDLFR